MNSAADEAGRGVAERDSRRRFAVAGLTALYCLAIFLALDFVYSRLFHHAAGSMRIPDPVFSHTLRPNFDGYDTARPSSIFCTGSTAHRKKFCAGSSTAWQSCDFC